MPLAKDLATDLRNFADRLETNPEAEITKAYMVFSHSTYGDSSKERFLAVAKLIPRPLKKSDGYSHDEVVLDAESNSITISARIPKKLTCTLIQPAKPAVYRCDPILSAEEDAELEAVNG